MRGGQRASEPQTHRAQQDRRQNVQEETDGIPVFDPIPPEERDPFWPVGYKPSGDAVEEEVVAVVEEGDEFEPKWADARKKLVVTGVMKISGGNVAIINEDVVGAGERVCVDHQGYTYCWEITEISPTRVQMTPLDVKPSKKTVPVLKAGK